MDLYYNAIVIFSLSSLAVLAVLIRENGRMQSETKRNLYQTYCALGLAMLMEWLAVRLNGAPEWTRSLHSVVKCLDYIFTPLVGIMFIRQMAQDGRHVRFVRTILAVNCLLQVSSIFTGWTFWLDENNEYHHGPLYLAYILIYLCVLLFVVYQFREFGQRFKKRNRRSLYLTVLMAVTGIAVQEITGLRLSYLSLTMSAALLFVHNNEFNQMERDDEIQKQRSLLMTDAMTGLKSRYAYSELLNQYNRKVLSDSVTVFMIDINGLKATNNARGHLAGDELIMGMAKCISDTFSPFGTCFRTGGDEFVVILETDDGRGPELSDSLAKRVREWKGTLTRQPACLMALPAPVNIRTTRWRN